MGSGFTRMKESDTSVTSARGSSSTHSPERERERESQPPLKRERERESLPVETMVPDPG